MSFEYNTMTFGKKNSKLSVLHFKKPLGNGFAGMVTSKLFPQKIALVVEDIPAEEMNYDFACLAASPGYESIRILMERDIFYGIKQNNKMARTILFHEIGHFIYNHLQNGMADMDAYDKERYSLSTAGKVMPQEVEADSFAAEYLGGDYVVDGLRMLIEETERRNDKIGIDKDETIIVTDELLRRISILSERTTGAI